MANSDAEIKGKLVILGFGSIAQAFLPLLFRHISIPSRQVTIVSRSEDKTGIASSFGVNFKAQALTRDNYQACLDGLLAAGDFLLNLSVDVASEALILYCQQKDILYLDTCTEPWPGEYTNADATISQRSNYQLRESMLALRDKNLTRATAIITHGANPGLVSAFVKQALVNMATDNQLAFDPPTSRQAWAMLAQRLGIKVIHIAERDTQTPDERKSPGTFINTWSVSGFLSEGLQPAELGWGTHEKALPEDGCHHEFGCHAAIYLTRPGLSTRVRSWTPLQGPYVGYLVTHGESISIADYLTLEDKGKVTYRPTVHYAYHPCDDAVLSILEVESRQWQEPDSQHILRDEIVEGTDELGVLLMGNRKGAYWYGSRLTIDEARKLAPHNSATSLQVVAGVLAGMIWALKHPRQGLIEPDELDYADILEIAKPYLGEMVGEYSDWTPIQHRSRLFPESMDILDPWQFINFRVI